MIALLVSFVALIVYIAGTMLAAAIAIMIWNFLVEVVFDL